MHDAASTYHPLDPGRIDSMDSAALKYWREELGCTEAELVAAIAKVGEHVAAVREELEARR